MKVLMFGWELPPIYAGGIGMVCYDLLCELTNQGHQVTYLMPFGPSGMKSETGAHVLFAEEEFPTIKTVSVKHVDTLLAAYQTPLEYQSTYTKATQEGGKKSQARALYGPNLYTEVDLFAKRAWEIGATQDFDVIHAHDWMTFPAAIAAADRSGKPLVVHVHNTIYDRYLGNASSVERDIEYNGFSRADKIIAISYYVKQTIVEKYGIAASKIEVVHNAPNTLLRKIPSEQTVSLGSDKVVLFTGRITAQKGPEYFVQCAKRVLEKREDVRFVMAGTGDMFRKTVDLAANLGISHKFMFTGFYNMKQAKALYNRADCYVMPSVSEPFGIVPLEAMEAGAPTIISRTSGVTEVVSHALKVDFWDIDQMANKVLAVLQYPALSEELARNGQSQVSRMNWSAPASKCVQIYQSLR
jgi:glycosyltransferase involved in cell wall biosynthesis